MKHFLRAIYSNCSRGKFSEHPAFGGGKVSWALQKEELFAYWGKLLFDYFFSCITEQNNTFNFPPPWKHDQVAQNYV